MSDEPDPAVAGRPPEWAIGVGRVDGPGGRWTDALRCQQAAGRDVRGDRACAIARIARSPYSADVACRLHLFPASVG